MSKFVHAPATLSDLPSITQISRAAFKDNQHTVSYWMFPRNNEIAIYEWRLNSITNIFKNVPYCTYTKVVDTTIDKIVAYALWESPHPSDMEEEEQPHHHQENENKENSDNKEAALPPGTNERLFHDFEAETQRMRTKYVNKQKDHRESWQPLLPTPLLHTIPVRHRHKNK